MLSHVNVGTGRDIAIRDLAMLVAEITGFEGNITTDPSKPDGTPRKLVDATRINSLGWSAKTSLESGTASTYNSFLNNNN